MQIGIKKLVPAVIETNYEEIQNQLTEGLKKYGVTVTQETVTEANKMATELNQLAGQIDRFRKDKVAEVSVPIKDFEAKLKNLIAMAQDARSKILEQVKVFEDQKRQACEKLLSNLLGSLREKYTISSNFYRVGFSDLVILSNLTPAGSLTKKASDELEKRVYNLEKQLQDKVATRLLVLENESYKAGLKTPLTEFQVQHILLTQEDNEYLSKLQEIISNELGRQAKLEQQFEAQKQREAEKLGVEGQKNTQQTLTFQEITTPAPPTTNTTNHIQSAHSDTDDEVVLVATFKIRRSILSSSQNEEAKKLAGMPSEMMCKSLEERLRKAGFASLAGVCVMK